MVLEIPNSVDGQVRGLLMTHTARHRLNVTFEGFGIRILLNLSDLIERLRHYYLPFVSDDSAVETVHAIHYLKGPLERPIGRWIRRESKSSPKEEFLDLPSGRIVHKLRTGMYFYFDGINHLALGDCLGNCNQVVNFIDSRYVDFRLRRNALLLHAAGVAREHQGVAISGKSGQGKSTLALHLVGDGFDYLSNDRLILDRELPGVRIYGLPKSPRVNPGTLLHNRNLRRLLPPERQQEIDPLSPTELWNLEEKTDVLIHRDFGDVERVLLARFSAMVVLNWRHTSEPTTLRPIDLSQRADLLEHVFKLPGPFCPNARYPHPTYQQYADALRPIDCYEIGGGHSFPRAVEYIRNLFDSSCIRDREF